jgi:hypothetical protein
MFSVQRAIGSGFGALIFVVGANVLGAAAAVVPPSGELNGAAQTAVTSIGWMCEGRRCFWRPEYAGPVPPFAAAWGPPESPTCYYVQRRISKRWRQICPEVPWQAR